jgi:hypothetical protein
MARRKAVRGTPAAAVLSGGMNRAFFTVTPEEADRLRHAKRMMRLERLADLTLGHGAMCPCEACRELRAM